jgi:hypothetical protein
MAFLCDGNFRQTLGPIANEKARQGRQMDGYQIGEAMRSGSAHADSRQAKSPKGWRTMAPPRCGRSARLPLSRSKMKQKQTVA